MNFNQLPLQVEVLNGIEKAGFSSCTLCQEMALPTALEGKDLLLQSKTGSGKTAIFLLTVLEKYLESDRKSKALIISPTRELAVQIEEDAKVLSCGIKGYRIESFFGGVGFTHQEEALKEGVDLYVGTPGRLLDYLHSGKIDFKSFDIVILDEADRLFDMGFFPDIEKMFSRMRRPNERQTLLFSATLSTSVRNLAWKFMNEPEEITVQPEEITVKKIDQRIYHVASNEKFKLLLGILKKHNPESCLIFTNTKGKAVEVSKRLNLNGYKTEYLMGDMPQSKRLQTLDRMKEGKLHYLIATDVAARGLQIDDLEMVVNYDIPEDFENYVHRIGRTARAGKSGIAVTIGDEEYIYGLEAIENYIQMKIPVHWSDEDGIEEVEDKSAGIDIRGARNNKRPNGNNYKKGNNNNSSYKRQNGPDQSRKKYTKNPGKPSDSKESTEFKKLEHLSVEERMAYYQKRYSGEKTQKKGKYGGNNPPQNRKKQNSRGNSHNQNNAASVRVKEESTVQSPAVKKPEVKKKEGLISRIKGFFKRKNEKG